MSDLGLLQSATATERRSGLDVRRRAVRRISSRRLDRTVAQLVALTDYAAVFLIVAACDVLYHLVAYDTAGTIYGLRFAAVAAVTYITIITFKDGYGLNGLVKRGRGVLDWEMLWAATLAADLVILFLLGQGGDLSRGITLLALASGALLLPPLHKAQGMIVRHAVARYGVRARDIVLIGREADVSAYLADTRPETQGFLAAAAVYLPDRLEKGHRLWMAETGSTDAMALPDAVAAIRHLSLDDAVLVLPWEDPDLLEEMVATFVQLPVSLVLAPDPEMQASLERGVTPLGRLTAFETPQGLVGLPLFQQPFTLIDRAAKRMIDVAGALTGLIILAPLFALLALLIKLDSPGPAIYRQVRNGFNEAPFAIFKFRSMAWADRTVFEQAQPNDRRVTRIGRLLRRYNLDELPQLVNVLIGDMSLVGPRPHAAEHNASIAGRIVHYACRHHVKPGITGWAQIHGLRGAADDEAMRGRVAYDLDYIQNWSPWLDIRILLATVFSRASYRNAR